LLTLKLDANERRRHAAPDHPASDT